MTLRILVVDDGFAGEKLARLLRREGHEACVVSTTRLALRRYASCRHEVVVLDLHMPGAGNLLRRLRSRGVSIIGLAATAVDHELVDASSVVLQRPFSLAQLVEAVRSATEITRADKRKPPGA